jgi:hypothetical protein
MRIVAGGAAAGSRQRSAGGWRSATTLSRPNTPRANRKHAPAGLEFLRLANGSGGLIADGFVVARWSMEMAAPGQPASPPDNRRSRLAQNPLKRTESPFALRRRRRGRCMHVNLKAQKTAFMTITSIALI